MSLNSAQWAGKTAGDAVAGGLSLSFRVWELLVVTVALQIGMLPLMARDFHRVTLSAPLVNLAAVPMVGILVPLGFLTLVAGLILPAFGKLVAVPLVWITGLMIHAVQWFAHFPRWSYRIPGPPSWLVLLFFVLGTVVAVGLRLQLKRRSGTTSTLQASLKWASFIWIICALLIAI